MTVTGSMGQRGSAALADCRPNTFIATGKHVATGCVQASPSSRRRRNNFVREQEAAHLTFSELNVFDQSVG